MFRNTLARIILAAFATTIILPSLATQAAGTNLIVNPSAETADSANAALPAAWLEGNWGTNTATFSYSSLAEDGAKGLTVNVANYVSGDAKWYFAPIAVTAGSTYAFSDYYQSDVPTLLVAQYTTASGANSYADLGTQAPAAVWSQAKTSFTVPVGVTTMTVFHLLASNGSLTIDNAALSLVPTATPTLTPTPTPSTTPVPTATPSATPAPTPAPPVMTAGNLVPNPGVEQAGFTPTVPNAWKSDSWGTNTPIFKYLATGHSSSHSLQIVMSGYSSGDAKWDFAPVAVTGGLLYDFSDWYKSTGTTDVVAAFTLSNGATAYADLGTPAASSTWKQFKGVFTAPVNAVAVTVMHAITANGTLTTDDYFLTPDAIAVTAGIPNNSFEQASFTNAKLPAGWYNGGWGTNTTTYSYLNTGHMGTHSIKMATTAFTSGDAAWAYAPQPVVSGGRYRFTDWYISNRISEVELQMTMADGTTQYLTIGHPGVASSWAQFSTIVNLPAGVTSVVALHLIAGVGTLTLDDYSFVQAPVVPFSRPLVSVTFDDGWATQYVNGLPILKQYQIPATFYLISGSLNQAEYLTTAQAKAIQSASNELGSHTVTHSDLTTLSTTKLNKELSGSQMVLQQLFGGSIVDFAAPYGTYNQKTIAAIQKYYRSQRTTDAGYNTKDGFDAYSLKVQNVDINTTETMVDGWLAEANREGAWLILVYHEVRPEVDPVNHLYNTTPKQLDANLAAIKASGITPVTISQGLSETLAQ